MSNVSYLKIVSPVVAELRSSSDNWLLQRFIADTPEQMEAYLKEYYPNTVRIQAEVQDGN